MGLRFRSDKLVPDERFEWLREQLGDAFMAVELDDEDANPDGLIAPHSVVTEHLIDEPGSRTRQALDDVLELFRDKLLVGAADYPPRHDDRDSARPWLRRRCPEARAETPGPVRLLLPSSTDNAPTEPPKTQ